MTRSKTEFDEFMTQVEGASGAAGEAEALAAYSEHFRLARQVIQLRQKAGWTQQQLAKASGIQQSEISRIERGQGNPTFRTLNALAHSGGMTICFVSEKTVRVRASRRSRSKRSGQRNR